MRLILTMAPAWIHGTRHERVRIVGAVGVRFALGAFFVACAQHYLNPFISTDISTNLAPVLGGLVVAALGTFVKSV